MTSSCRPRAARLRLGVESLAAREVPADLTWVSPGPGAYDGPAAADTRPFVNAVLWVARTGDPWRDLPGRYGHRDTA